MSALGKGRYDENVRIVNVDGTSTARSEAGDARFLSFNGKPKATAFLDHQQSDDADACGLPLNDLIAR